VNAAEHLLGETALARHGERLALLCGDEAFTYAELADSVRRAAAALHSLGVQPGDCVLLLMRDTPEFAAAWLGAVRAGAVVVALNSRLSEAEYRHVLRDSAARFAIVEDVFLLNHKDGLLIKHETRRLRPDVDTDILSGMLTAVQAFVKDALRGDDYADLNEMTVGHMHILIGRGKWLVLAARIEGDGSQSWTTQIERCIKDMEDHHWDQIEDWDGDMGLARVLTPYIKKLIQGGYT